MPPVSAMEGTGMISIRVGKRRSDAASARAADRRGSWKAWTVSTAAQSVTRDFPLLQAHRVRRQTTHIGEQRMPPVSAMEGTGMTSIRVGKRRSDAASARAADRRGSWNAWTVSTAAQGVTRDSP